VKTYPAVVIRGIDPDFVALLVDEFSPVAIEPRDEDVRVFFASAGDRDAAQRALGTAHDVAPADISDEDWARRSQESLQPVTVGRLTIFPSSQSEPRNPQSAIHLVIEPSMGFGTGHHATTRLCLAALQAIDLGNRTVLDVGTGSGVLALAAVLLGATRAIGIDRDQDAIQSARENLGLNPEVGDRVAFSAVDLAAAPLPPADVVTANLTGPLLVRAATVIAPAVRSGGALIVSGLLVHERGDVARAYAPMEAVWEREEDGWAGLVMKKR
jgi:ribosomal protein L11 methyltransferase